MRLARLVYSDKKEKTGRSTIDAVFGGWYNRYNNIETEAHYE